MLSLFHDDMIQTVGSVNWVTRWESALEACRSLKGDARELIISDPASEAQIRQIESSLHLSLPVEFRQTLLEFSSAVEFSWFLPDDIELPEDFREIFCGHCSWDLSRLIEIEEGRRSWVSECFPNAEDEYDVVWHNKLAFLDVGNGDMLALDLNCMPIAPVIYLSHDDGEGHGYKLGDSFTDFIERWSLLGCPGAEDWQMLPFISAPTSGLEPNGESAQKWRTFFGLKV